MNDWLSARHLLAVRLDNSGDVVMLEPALRAIKETLPRARLLRRSTSCHPCYLFECPIGPTCLAIPAEEVIETVENLLDTSEPIRAQERVSGMGGSK